MQHSITIRCTLYRIHLFNKPLSRYALHVVQLFSGATHVSSGSTTTNNTYWQSDPTYHKNYNSHFSSFLVSLLRFFWQNRLKGPGLLQV
jgi:hypothetical protein